MFQKKVHSLPHCISVRPAQRRLAPLAIAMLAGSAVILLWAPQDAPAQEKEAKRPAAKSLIVPNPTLILLRDPTVQADLQMRDDQKQAMRDLLDEIDPALWLLRDTTPEEGSERLQVLIGKVKSRLGGILNGPQLKRFDQIVLQGQGPEALNLPGVAQKLGLSSDQKLQIRETIETRRDEMKALLKQVQEGKEKDGDAKAKRIREAGNEELLVILKENQQKQWAAMLGKAIDLSSVRYSYIKAPDIVTTPDWINSEPLTLGKLRGRVVALHFWTFG